MKILRSSEWEPVFWVKQFPGLGPAYVFRNKRYGDVLALKVAKYVDVAADDTYVYDADNRIISYRADGSETSEITLPTLRVNHA